MSPVLRTMADLLDRIGLGEPVFRVFQRLQAAPLVPAVCQCVGTSSLSLVLRPRRATHGSAEQLFSAACSLIACVRGIA